MSSSSSSLSKVLLLRCLLLHLSMMVAFAGNFYQDFNITFGGDRAKIMNGGKTLSLSLDQASGSGFISKHEYLFGRINMELKLVAGNSAGTVTAYYLSSKGPKHDEIDIEFLGNLTGSPYTLHTNVFTEGKGNREQQFHLWFDPTKKFHSYSVVWNPVNIIFLVDNIPIRQFKNEESKGVLYPRHHPMRIHSSLWDADQWATRGGSVKTNWSNAPFTAFYRNFNANACIWSSGSSFCSSESRNAGSEKSWQDEGPDVISRKKLRWVRRKYMIYDYCTDLKRYPKGLPLECRR